MAVFRYSLLMSQIFFFTGENTYALSQEKKRWAQEFRAKHGPENYIRLEPTGLTFRMFLDEIAAAPFIAEKRLIVVEGTPKFSKEESVLIPDHLHPSCVLLIVDPKPDKRLSATKELQKISTLKQFPVLDARRLASWMDQEAKNLGTTIEVDARSLLVDIVGEDQEMLSSELAKCSLAAFGRSITREDVEELAVPSGEREIFTLTNLIAAGKVEQALRYAQGLMERGETAQSLWGILLWMLECLTLVTAAVAEHERNPAKIASQMGVPFPSVRSLMPLASNVDLAALKRLVSETIAADIDLKTGGYRATAEAPEELVALIDRLVLGCGKLTMKK